MLQTLQVWWVLSILGSHHQYQRSTSETMERVRMHQTKGIKTIVFSLTPPNQVTSQVVMSLESALYQVPAMTPPSSSSEQFRVLLTTTNLVKCLKHYKWWVPSILGSHHQYQRFPQKPLKQQGWFRAKGMKIVSLLSIIIHSRNLISFIHCLW